MGWIRADIGGPEEKMRNEFTHGEDGPSKASAQPCNPVVIHWLKGEEGVSVCARDLRRV